MSAPLSLIQDHVLLRRTLVALEVFLGQTVTTQHIVRSDLERFVTFFTVFGDELHAQKEEEIVLPYLVRAGVDWDQGPVPDVCRAHNQERYLLRVLGQLAAQERTYDGESIRKLASELTEFLACTRTHLNLEDLEVLPLVERIPAAERERLEADLARFDASTPYYAIMVDLAERSIAKYSALQKQVFAQTRRRDDDHKRDGRSRDGRSQDNRNQDGRPQNGHTREWVHEPARKREYDYARRELELSRRELYPTPA